MSKLNCLQLSSWQLAAHKPSNLSSLFIVDVWGHLKIVALVMCSLYFASGKLVVGIEAKLVISLDGWKSH